MKIRKLIGAVFFGCIAANVVLAEQKTPPAPPISTTVICNGIGCVAH